MTAKPAEHNTWLEKLTALRRTPLEPVPPAPSPVPPSRRKRTAITTWQDTAAVKQLKDLAHKTERSQQELIAEALNLLFERYKKPPVAI
jgi:hypothetical protein